MTRLISALSLLGLLTLPVAAQPRLNLPARSADAPTGSAFVGQVKNLGQSAREARIAQSILAGNVPPFLRNLKAVDVSATINGVFHQGTFYVTPDYLAVGTNADFFRTPMGPLTAQSIVDQMGCLLPTRKMVDAIWAASTVKLNPQPINPSTANIMSLHAFWEHHNMVESQRRGNPLGPMVAGIKKDVVITPRLITNPGRVAIYGWHYTTGSPIQPLYLGHIISYADYSHGIRPVQAWMHLDGVEVWVSDVLADPDLHVLLSDEGPLTRPRYQ